MIDTGGSAFPREEQYYDGTDIPARSYYEGMTLRDYFAGQALTGTAGNPEDVWKSFEDQAEWCYKIADAMIKERNK